MKWVPLFSRNPFYKIAMNVSHQPHVSKSLGSEARCEFSKAGTQLSVDWLPQEATDNYTRMFGIIV